ncbi:MAG: prolipoprotein diacylglyceryl transferase, partial [Candidatus Woesearchaeota archaeon]|nr:prolipoprotein diacylglyceryl transferase [Candidatus Woesearchaeota archaeon]
MVCFSSIFLNPALMKLGPFEVRWYGVLMAAAFIIGYFILRKLAKDEKINGELIDIYFIYLFFGLIIGARIGEILFYSPNYYLKYPLEMVKIWHGGLSSHGAFIGGIIATLLFARKYSEGIKRKVYKKSKISFYKIADIAVIPIALGSVFVRIGNFINGEIVGRVASSSLPWAISFEGYAGLRHPVQIYEALMNFFIFGFLILTRNIKKKKKMPNGIVFWSFLFVYSLLRFFVEFFKEFQEIDAGWPIT